MNPSKRDIERQVEQLSDGRDDRETGLRQEVPVALVEEWLDARDADATQYEWLQKVSS